MSTLSEQAHLSPHDPAYYAPRWIRERSGSRSAKPQDATPDPPFFPASFNTRLEDALSAALRRPHDTEVIHDPEFTHEADRRRTLLSIAGRFAAAIGAAAVVALFFVVMVPASRQQDAGSTVSGIVQSITAAFVQSSPEQDASKPAIDEFQAFLASVLGSRPATPEKSEQLLKQFQQWRQKTAPTAP